MGRGTTIVIALLLLSVGCSGDGREEDVPSPPPVQPTFTPVPTTPASRPTEAPLSTQQAATAYLAAVRPRNSALAKFDADWKGTAPVETLRLDAALVVAAERRFLKVLDTTVWPPSIAENADNVAYCVASNISWYDALIRVKSAADIKSPPACGASDAQLIRIRLQLPGY